MKTITIEDRSVVTTIEQKLKSSSCYCDVTLKDNVPILRVTRKYKGGSDGGVSLDFSKDGLQFLLTLLE